MIWYEFLISSVLLMQVSQTNENDSIEKKYDAEKAMSSETSEDALWSLYLFYFGF